MEKLRTPILLKNILSLVVIGSLLLSPAFAGINNIEEQDGTPSVYPWKLKVTNGTLTDNGDGTASLSTGGGGGSPGTPLNSIQYNSASTFAGDLSFSWNAPGNFLSISRDLGQIGYALAISGDLASQGTLANISHDGSAMFQTVQLQASPLSSTEGGTGTRTAGNANALVYYSATTAMGSLTADTTAGHVLVSTATAPNFRQLLSSDISGTLAVTQGGTGSTTLGTSNALTYYTVPGQMASLTADTTAGHVLVSTTTLPNFRQLLTSDETGTMPVARGGTGIVSGTSGAIPFFNSTGSMATTLLFAANAVVVGGGAGVAPKTITADATVGHVLISTATSPTFRQLLTSDSIGTESVARGGTGITSGTANGVVIFSTTGLMASTTADSATTHAFMSTAGQPAFRQILTTDVVGTYPASTTPPGGATTNIQYNSNSTFAGASFITTDGVNVSIGPGTGGPVSMDVAGNFRTLPFALTDAATIATDASRSNIFTVQLGGNRILGTPTNGANGQKVIWIISQDSAGSRLLTYSPAFRFGTTVTSPTLTTTAGKADYIGAVYNVRGATPAAQSWDVVAVAQGY